MGQIIIGSADTGYARESGDSGYARDARASGYAGYVWDAGDAGYARDAWEPGDAGYAWYARDAWYAWYARDSGDAGYARDAGDARDSGYAGYAGDSGYARDDGDAGHYWYAYCASVGPGTYAIWRSDHSGQPVNGGAPVQPASPGVTHSESGPLTPCEAGTLHATYAPEIWIGDRYWAVEVIGHAIGNRKKIAMLTRRIVHEIGATGGGR